LTVAVARCKSHRKWFGTYEVQAPREDLDRQAIISTDSTYIVLFHDYVIKLVENMSRRCQTIINNEGD